MFDGVSESAGLEALRPGRLLVANPLLPDPNFDRTVVFLLAYGTEGALGLVLNRPSETRLAAPLAAVGAHWPPRLRWCSSAGPVQQQAVICLARTRPAPAADVPPEAWTSGACRRSAPSTSTSTPTACSAAFSQVRIFAGYAGWSPGQLEAEIAAGAWWILDPAPDDPFSDEPEMLWKRVLRRQTRVAGAGRRPTPTTPAHN